MMTPSTVPSVSPSARTQLMVVLEMIPSFFPVSVLTAVLTFTLLMLVRTPSSSSQLVNPIFPVPPSKVEQVTPNLIQSSRWCTTKSVIYGQKGDDTITFESTHVGGSAGSDNLSIQDGLVLTRSPTVASVPNPVLHLQLCQHSESTRIRWTHHLQHSCCC